MMLQEGTWPSRALAIAILLLVLLAGYHLLLTPVLERHAVNAARIDQLSRLVDGYRDLVATRPELAERLAESEGQDRAENGYWQGESAVRIAARLQDRVTRAIEAHGGRLVSVQTLKAEPGEDTEAGIQRTALNMRLTATVDGLASIMQEVEAATPYMFIDQLSVTQQRTRRLRGQTDADDQASRLDVRLDVFGYVQGQAPPDGVAEGADGETDG